MTDMTTAAVGDKIRLRCLPGDVLHQAGAPRAPAIAMHKTNGELVRVDPHIVLGTHG